MDATVPNCTYVNQSCLRFYDAYLPPYLLDLVPFYGLPLSFTVDSLNYQAKGHLGIITRYHLSYRHEVKRSDQNIALN